MIDWLEERTFYTGGDFNEDIALFKDIKELLEEVTEKYKIPENYFYYMAIPPFLFATVAEKDRRKRTW